MSEQEASVELELEPESVEPIQEYSEIEQEAIEHGWNPEGAEGKRNLTAEEFMDRKPLYDDIHSLKKQLKRTQDGIEAMRQMQEGIRQREREKTIKELKEQKKLALETENYDAVLEIDDKIASENAEAAAPVQNVAFEKWVEDNDWYNQDSEMKEYADTIGNGYLSKHPGIAPSEVFNYVTKEVKARFKEKFENENRSKPSSVEGATRGRKATSAKHRAADLPEQDRQLMKTILRATPNMTEADYLKDYFGE